MPGVEETETIGKKPLTRKYHIILEDFTTCPTSSDLICQKIDDGLDLLWQGPVLSAKLFAPLPIDIIIRLVHEDNVQHKRRSGMHFQIFHSIAH